MEGAESVEVDIVSVGRDGWEGVGVLSGCNGRERRLGGERTPTGGRSVPEDLKPADRVLFEL